MLKVNATKDAILETEILSEFFSQIEVHSQLSSNSKHEFLSLGEM